MTQIKIGDLVTNGKISGKVIKETPKQYQIDTGEKTASIKKETCLWVDPDSVLTPAQCFRKAKNEILLKEQTRIELDSDVLLVDEQSWELFYDDHWATLCSLEEIGFDLETYGFDKQDDALDARKGEIRLIQVYVPDIDKTLVWDLGGIEERSSSLQGNAYELSSLPGGHWLKATLNRFNVKKYIHNAAFECQWINHKLGIQLFNIVDSMILSQVFWAGLFKGMNSLKLGSPNSLKAVCFRLGLGEVDKEDQLWDYGFGCGNRQYNYGAKDSKLCYLAGKKLLEKGKAIGVGNPMEAELIAIPAFAQMRFMGFPIDVDKLQKTYADYCKVEQSLRDDWDREFPGVNPNSSAKAGKAMMSTYPEIDLNVISETTGKPTVSTAYDALAPYFGKYPIAEVLGEISSIAKGREYLEKLIELKQVNCLGIPVVCGQFKQLADQAVGRSGCSSPNLQNPPKLAPSWKKRGLTGVRDCFAVPKGRKLIVLDLDAAHSQIARVGSQDAKLLEANRTGTKIHYYTSQGILELQGKKYTIQELAKIKKDKTHPGHDNVSKTYDLAKIVYYSFLNWGGAYRLQVTFLQNDPPIHVDLETCKMLVAGTRKAYPGLYKYLQNIHAKSNSVHHQIPVWFDEKGKPVHWGMYIGTPPENWIAKPIGQFRGFYGEVRSLDGGRYFIEKFPNKYKNGKWETKVGDTSAAMWQRVEATCLKGAAGEITEYFKLVKPEWEAWITNFCHDELDICVKEEYSEECAKHCLEVIDSHMKRFVPDYSSETTLENVHETCVMGYWAK